jgi:uncharacterized protein YyaL (SSP411 family)
MCWFVDCAHHFERMLYDNAQLARVYLHAMAILNNLVLGLLRRQGFPYLPDARRYYAANLGKAVALVIRANP